MAKRVEQFSEKPNTRRSTALKAAVCSWIAGVLSGWLVFHQAHRENRVASQTEEHGVVDTVDPKRENRDRSSQRPSVSRDFLTRPRDLWIARDAEAEEQYQEKQAKEIVDLLRSREAQASIAMPGMDPETIAAQSLAYLHGLADGVIRTAPELTDSLAREIESSLCDNDARPSTRIVMLRMVMSIPELGTEEGFECVFSNHFAEDAVLWIGIDAWKASGLPITKTLVRLQQEARDSRTLRRLKDDEAMADVAR